VEDVATTVKNELSSVPCVTAIQVDLAKQEVEISSLQAIKAVIVTRGIECLNIGLWGYWAANKKAVLSVVAPKIPPRSGDGT